MKKLILTASAIALFPVAAHAQLLGGGSLGGTLGGSLGGTVNSTIGSQVGGTLDRTTRTVRNTVRSTANVDAATEGEQSVDARNGTVSTRRNANGSAAASTASLADLAVPALGNGSASASGQGQASGQGSANAQLIGTDAVTGAIAPVAGQTVSLAGSAAGTATATARGAASSAPGLPALGGNAQGSGEGSASGNGSASLIGSSLAVAGSAASRAAGAASVSPGMPVTTPDGASLGTVKEVVANGRGEVQSVVVKQGKVTRTLPAGMFSAEGNALVAGSAQGEARGGATGAGQAD